MNLDELSLLLQEMGSPHQYFVQWVEPSVYHYTDLAGLHGIVSARDLWLTDSRYSNDSEEMSHGYEMADLIIARHLETHANTQERKFLRRVRRALDESRDLGVYVCCFCLRGDLLGQWRSYGANGTGVSLQVATNGFEFVSGPDMPPAEFGLVYLWRVFYEPEHQQRLIQDCLNRVWERPVTVAQKIELATDALRFFIPIFKNQDFQEEQEVRLAFIPAPTCPVAPEFRVARGMLVPYYSLRALANAAERQDWQVPIESVRIGPSALREDNRRSVELFLHRAGYPDVTVETSHTPYRG